MCVNRTANCSDVPITQKGLIELKVTLPRNTYSENKGSESQLKCGVMYLTHNRYFWKYHQDRLSVRQMSSATVIIIIIIIIINEFWSRGLRRRAAVARLLRSWVRIPAGAWMFGCCECCVLSGRGLCDELITRPEESYRLCCFVVCDLETTRMRRP